MDHERYDGWRNYETWAVKLWLDNEASSYEFWKEATRLAVEQASVATSGTDRSESISDLARSILIRGLKAEIHEAAPELRSSLFADLINLSLCAIDWYAIADSLLTEHAEDSAACSAATEDDHHG